jgi:hypothetical protein
LFDKWKTQQIGVERMKQERRRTDLIIENILKKDQELDVGEIYKEKEEKLKEKIDETKSRNEYLDIEEKEINIAYDVLTRKALEIIHNSCDNEENQKYINSRPHLKDDLASKFWINIFGMNDGWLLRRRGRRKKEN